MTAIPDAAFVLPDNMLVGLHGITSEAEAAAARARWKARNDAAALDGFIDAVCDGRLMPAQFDRLAAEIDRRRAAPE